MVKISRTAHVVALAGLSAAWSIAPGSGAVGYAVAETMRCQSVNGNVNCAGSGGVACQTVNGKKVCTSGNGDVVQSFGGSPSSDAAGGAKSTGAKSTGAKSTGAASPGGLPAGGGKASGQGSDDAATADGDEPDDPAADPKIHTHVEQRGPGGRTLQLDRNGSKLQLHTDRLTIERE